MSRLDFTESTLSVYSESMFVVGLCAMPGEASMRDYSSTLIFIFWRISVDDAPM